MESQREKLPRAVQIHRSAVFFSASWCLGSGSKESGRRGGMKKGKRGEKGVEGRGEKKLKKTEESSFEKWDLGENLTDMHKVLKQES